MGAATPAEVWGRGGEREEEVNGREEGGLWGRRGVGKQQVGGREEVICTEKVYSAFAWRFREN